MACAKSCWNLVTYHWITLKRIFHRIWIANKIVNETGSWSLYVDILWKIHWDPIPTWYEAINDIDVWYCWCWSFNQQLTHWGRVTHICVSKLTIIGSDNGLSPGRRQAIIWTNAGILSIGLLGTNFNEILIEIHTFSFKKLHLKMSSAKRRPFCLGLNVLINN